MSWGLEQKIVLQIRGVFEKYPQIEKVILYGSRAKGTHKTGSDIDLTLVGEKLALRELNAIDNALDDLLLPYSFDLSIFHHIDDPELLGHIERVGVVFYDAREIIPQYKASSSG